MRKAGAALAVVALLAAMGCTSARTAKRERPAPVSAPAAAPSPARGACDDADPSACLLPWPNDRFTRRDRSTSTGRRLDLPATGMPANVGGVRIDPPVTNLPNRGGADPHGKLSNVPEALALVLAFVRDQRLIDVCNRQPCQSR